MSQDVFYKKDSKSGIIEQVILSGIKMEYRSAVNLKQFYNDLHEYFLTHPSIHFQDSIGTKAGKKIGDFFDFQNKEGEFVEDNANLNRHGDMFEKKFTWAKNDKSVEFELVWEAKAKTPHSAHGWFEVRIDLVNRNIVDIEVEKNGKKEKLQNGTWEFRNKIIYKNNIVPKFLRNVPFVKNSETLQDFYLKNVQLKRFEEDYEWCNTKIKKPLIDFIESYFASNSNN